MTTTQDRVGTSPRRRVVEDRARGRRVVEVGADGLPVRIALADGTALHIARDDERRTLTVSDAGGTRLLRLAALGDAGRHGGPDGASSAARNHDGTYRLAAEDDGGRTVVDASETTARVERGGAVLRIDSDGEGRPRRATVPGLPADLHYRSTGAGFWEIGAAGGPPLLRLTESPGATRVEVSDTGAGWVENRAGDAVSWSDLTDRALLEVRLDVAGRVVRRHWAGGVTHAYGRDEEQRLTAWRTTAPDGTTSRTVRTYRGGDLSDEVSDGRRTVVRTDAGGRVVRRIAPLGSVTYEYDPNGRRVARTERGRRTAYVYDVLGRLTEVTLPDGTAVRYGWDGLGRRVWVERDGRRLHEHRDPAGRLWSVTDDDGALVHAFLWWAGRVLARCDASGAVDEAYLTDHAGTLMGVLAPGRDADGGPGRRGAWVAREAIQPPFGAVTAPWRPTLFGHVADGSTALICFGARELDPETGVFLTPDPWHGELDDPRRAGLGPRSAAALVLDAEAPLAGIHPYALSQWDPLSRPDVDGHFAWGNLILTLLLAPTWGFPLTSLSVFFFEPINLYFEVIGLIVTLFTWGDHPWPQHSLGTMRGLSGSGQVGTFALALNGFLPRATAGGVGGDRCVTIGHVVWENRRYFHMIDRPRVLALDDVRGTPAADGTPSADARKFSDAPRGSVLAVVSKDADNREWVHGTWWTRGPGNAVGLRGVAQSFEDRVAPGTAHARGTVFLAQPLPEIMPKPREASPRERLEAVEYRAAAHSSDGELVENVWFAFVLPSDAGIAANDVIEVQAEGGIAPAYGKVLQVVQAERPVAILDHELGARFQNPPALRKKTLKLRVMTATATTSAGWTAGPGPANRSLQLAAPGHAVAVDDAVELSPAAAAGPVPATPERPNAYSRVAKVTTTLRLAPPVAALALAGASLYRVSTDGTALTGNVPDPAAHPERLTVTGRPDLAVDQLVAVQPTGGGAAAQYARITAVTPPVDAVPGVGGAPGTPATPATFTLDPPLTLPAATAVRVTRLKETNRDLDTATNAVQAGDAVTVEVRSSGTLAPGHAVRIEVGGAVHVRRVDALTMVAIETVDEVIGGSPYTLTRYEGRPATVKAKLSSARFVRHTGGDLPSAYGDWPAEMMGLVPLGYPPEREPMGWRFFLKASPRPAAMHPKFRDYWQPLTLGGTHYWLLASDLKIVVDGATHYWEPDPDDTYPRRHRQRILAGPIRVTVRGFAATGVKRPDAGGGAVLAFSAEAQVPDSPKVRWSLGDALADHELSHTVQNTYWGPFLGALPLQGVFRTIRDVVEASAEDPGTWMDWTPFDALNPGVGFNDTNVAELLSIGGLMQLVWTFVILGPALGDDAAREYLLGLDFADWGAVFNPLNQWIINQVPPVDRNVPESKDWKIVLANFAARALDLRSWTPLTGFVPLLLPDSPRNFLEQQASRWSGDLYSTILTANDRFNVTLSAIGNDRDDADLTSQLGDAVRMMAYNATALGRNTLLDRCDAPGSSLTHYEDYFSAGSAERFLRMEQASAAGHVLVPADLYEHVSGPAPTAVQIDGPTPTGGGAPPTLDCLRVPVGSVLAPRLRSIVPIPPAVMRAVGFYLLAAGPGTWTVSAYDGYAGTPDDPRAAQAEITVASRVELGADDVAYSEPFATGAAVAVPPATFVERFLTETHPLVVSGRDTSTWEAQADAGITLTRRAGGRGWDLAVAAPGAAALPHDARVRIWARVARDDAEIFDLEHDAVPTLRGRRSYLDDVLWIPVRDFVVRITDLPVLPAAAFAAAAEFDLTVPVKLAGRASIVPTGNLLSVERVEDVAPRGEKWRFRLAGRRAVEAARVVPVTVRFGSGAGAVERRFDLTVNPNFTIDKPAAVAAYEVTPAAPLVLTVSGGAGGFRVEAQPPSSSRASVAVSGATVTVTVAPPPAGAPAGPPAAPVNYDLVLRDSDDHLGVRTVTIRP